MQASGRGRPGRNQGQKLHPLRRHPTCGWNLYHPKLLWSFHICDKLEFFPEFLDHFSLIVGVPMSALRPAASITTSRRSRIMVSGGDHSYNLYLLIMLQIIQKTNREMRAGERERERGLNFHLLVYFSHAPNECN